MGRGNASGVDPRKQGEIGQSSGTQETPAKRARKEVEIPDLVFGEDDMDETHDWLEFKGAKQPHKNYFLNALYLLHRQPVCPPKYLDPIFARHYGVQADIVRWFKIEVRIDGRIVSSDMWNNIFNNREPVYRELCLEFYSTVRLTKELHKVKDIFEERIVSFFCGGQPRKLSIPEFGYYCGMYTREHLDNPNFRALLRKGLYVKQDLGDGESITQYWTRISGGHAWPTGGSVSVSKIQSVKLRLLHRMIVTFLVQRSTHWDKAYQLNLWLMKLFTEGAPRKFSLAPMVVLDRMVNHSDSKLVLGQFITRIYKRMGVFGEDACQEELPVAVQQESLTEKELILGKIVKKPKKNEQARLLKDTGVIAAPPEVEESDDDEEMEDAPQQPQRRRGHPRIDLTDMGAQLQRIIDEQQSSREAFDDYQRRMDQDMTWVGSQQAYTNYTIDYYQPMWDAQYHGKTFTPDTLIPDFSPPPIHVPSYRQGGQPFFTSTTPGNMSPRPHDLGGSPRGPVQFGSFQGGRDAGGSGGFTVGHDAGGSPSFDAGTSADWRPWPGAAGGDIGGSGGFGGGYSVFTGGDAGASGSGTAQEEGGDLFTSIFGSSVIPHGYHGQQQ